MGKTAFIFSGQGAQYVGMGKSLYENFPVAREIFDEADEVLKDRITQLCFDGPDESLQKTANTQPAVLVHSIACYSVLKKEGIIPDMVAGLSLGEYSALVAAESLEFRQAVPLVRKRGELIQETAPIGKGAMAAILGLKREDVLTICETASVAGVVEAANYNCPGQIVISGEVQAVKKAVELARLEGARRAIMLMVSAPFHCSLLKPVAESLAKELEKVKIKDSKIPIISNVNAEFVEEACTVKDLLIKQVSSPVLWEDSIKKMVDSDVKTFIEVGPGKILGSFIKRTDKDLKVLNVEDVKSLRSTINYFGG